MPADRRRQPFDTGIDNGMGDKQDAKFFGHYYLHGDDTLDKSLNLPWILPE
jgi:hypothetical protein